MLNRCRNLPSTDDHFVKQSNHAAADYHRYDADFPTQQRQECHRAEEDAEPINHCSAEKNLS